VNNNTEVDDSVLQVHSFELPVTLEELEWSGILGKTGLGWKLITWKQSLAAPYFELDPLYVAQKGRDQEISFEVEGVEHQIVLEFSNGLTATLLSAVREVINGANHALKCAQVGCRFVLERELCAGSRSYYRLILAPQQWLAELGRSLNLVAGISPEDYERDMLAPGRHLHLRDLRFSDPMEPRSLR